MKTTILSLVAAVLFSLSSFASPQSNVQKWSGSGSVFSPAGQELSKYQITVINTTGADQVVQSEATMTFADGTSKTVSQKITPTADGKWTVSSNLGQGGGTCYGQDVCENYIEGENGQAFATTIIADGVNGRRDLTIQLQNGKAVKIIRDNIALLQ